jgi:hypothetical protein
MDIYIVLVINVDFFIFNPPSPPFDGFGGEGRGEFEFGAYPGIITKLIRG